MAKKMGDGFYKRGKLWWFRTDPLTGKPASSGKRSIDAARAEYDLRSRQRTDPLYQTGATETRLGEWVVKLLEQKELHRAGGTVSYYKTKLGHVIRVFGADRVLDEAFRAVNWDGYVQTRRNEGARPTTILKEIGAAKVLAKFAARRGGFRGRPDLFKPDDMSDDYKAGERFLTSEELVLLLKELTPERRAHVALSVALASRYSEAFRVSKADVNLENWTVRIRGTKTKKSDDVIPVPEPMRPLLLLAIDHLPLKRWTNSNMVRDLARACSRAGIDRVTANDLRRTHASWLVEAGVPDSLVARMLRHVDERMVRKVYGRARPEKIGAAISAYMVEVATETQQLPAKGGPSHVETVPISSTCKTGEDRIENPRVGGSIPSRDTANSAESLQDPEQSSETSVSPDTAESRHVRYNNVTQSADGGPDYTEDDFEAALAESFERAEAYVLLCSDGEGRWRQ